MTQIPHTKEHVGARLAVLMAEPSGRAEPELAASLAADPDILMDDALQALRDATQDAPAAAEPTGMDAALPQKNAATVAASDNTGQPARPMGFPGSMKAVFVRYATFHGRASRPEYWWFALFLAVSICAIILLVTSSSSASLGTSRLLWSFVALIILPATAVGVRRLHDVGRSGLWYVAATVMLLIAAALHTAYPGIWLPRIATFILVIAGSLLLVLVSFWNLMRSAPGANRFGPNPSEL